MTAAVPRLLTHAASPNWTCEMQFAALCDCQYSLKRKGIQAHPCSQGTVV